MEHRIWVIALIDDPFDPPGEGRYGGGQSFIFDLGRGFVRQGFDVTYITQLNAPTKPRFERFGPRCRIYRLEAGEARYRLGEEAALSIDILAQKTAELLEVAPAPETIHAQYWVSGAVAVRVRASRPIPIFLYPMSFGRAKQAAGEARSPFSELREQIEPDVLVACDHVVVGTPDECALLRRHYESVRDEQILLAPLWCDGQLFSPRPEPADHYVRRAARRFAEGI